jgi:hypothetical protein
VEAREGEELRLAIPPLDLLIHGVWPSVGAPPRPGAWPSGSAPPRPSTRPSGSAPPSLPRRLFLLLLPSPDSDGRRGGRRWEDFSLIFHFLA